MRIVVGLTFVALSAAAVVASAQAGPPPDSRHIASSMRNRPMMRGFRMANGPELSAAINALLQDEGAHMSMLPKRPLAAGDSARAASIVERARAALSKYKDVRIAERDGYRKFMPWLENQAIYHYNNIGNAMAVVGAFDATRPISLLYKKDATGAMTLVGAMYSALPSSTPQDLDARLPTSIAHWHEHVNFCSASPDSVRAGVVKADAATAAHWLKITTRADCAAARGRFVPQLFGWMAHVYLFASNDPAVIWGADHGSMDVHMDVHQPAGR